MITIRKRVSFAELQKVFLVTPEDASDHWVGIQHADFIRSIHRACGERGWEAHLTTAALSNDLSDLSASINILSSHGHCELGLLTSNAQHFATTFFIGGVRDGVGFVTTEVGVGRRWEGTFDLRGKINGLLDEFETLVPQHEKTIKKLNSMELDKSELPHILFRSARFGSRRSRLAWSRLGQVSELFTKEHPDDGTHWDLLMCFARVIQRSPPMVQLEQLAHVVQLLLS